MFFELIIELSSPMNLQYEYQRMDFGEYTKRGRRYLPIIGKKIYD